MVTLFFRTILFIALVILLPNLTSASSYDWHTEGKPVSEFFDTLPISGHSQNFQMAQDETGRIYVANGRGLLIYNGENWQHIIHNNDEPIFSFALASEGKIYLGGSGDLGYFKSNSKGNWQYHSISNDIEIPAFNYVLNTISIGEHVLFGSDNILFHYHPDSGLSWKTENIAPAHFTYTGSHVLIPSRNGKLYKYFLEDRTLIEEKVDVELQEGYYFRGAIPLSNNEILFYNRDSLYKQAPTEKIRPFKTDIDKWLSEGRITHVIKLIDGHLAVNSSDKGIAIIDYSGKLIRYYNTNHGLKSPQGYQLLFDREQNLWITYQSSGISRVELFSPISQYSDGINYVLNSATGTLNNQIYIGAQDGLFRLQEAKTPEQQATFIKVEDTDYGYIFSLLDSKDGLFVGHNQGLSLLKVDEKGKHSSKLLFGSRDALTLDIRDIIQSSKDDDVIYAISAIGLLQIKKTNNSWQVDELINQFKGSLFSIYQDNLYDLWVGTSQGAIYKIGQLDNWPDVKIETVLEENNSGFNQTVLFGIGSNVLLGVDSFKAIKKAEKHNNNYKIFNSDLIDWLHYDIKTVDIAQQDNVSNLWIATTDRETRLAEISLITESPVNQFEISYSTLDHLEADIVTDLYFTKQNDIWINGRNYVHRYRQVTNKLQRKINQPIITKVTNMRSREILFSNSNFEDHNLKVTLDAKENAISIHFSAVDYANNKTLKYRYRLPEKPFVWSSWSRQAFVEIIDLSPGNSKISIQYRTNPDNVSPISHIDLYHTPYWHQLTWLRVLGLVLLIASFILVAVFYARYRNRTIILQATKLEKDVAERTEIISEQNKELRLMDEAKSRFFTNISHELRTPLTLAIGPLKEVLVNGDISNPQDLSHIKMALKNNQHMMSLIGQILDINRLESGNMPLKIALIDIAPTLQYCIQRFEFLAQKHSIHFSTIGFKSCYNFYFDADHFEKIMVNLISNAVKYSAIDSEIEIGVSLVTKKLVTEKLVTGKSITEKLTTDKLEIWVKDQGIGIDTEDQKYIFDRFYQGKKASHTIQPGTGIGLALAKELLSLHNGDISLNSTIGVGSQFTLHLALGKEHYDSSYLTNMTKASQPEIVTPELIATDYDKADIQAGQKTILIIDDNSDLRLFIRTTLESIYQIIEADNGHTGYQQALEKQPDVIVSDVMMPVMDGLQLAQKLRGSKETAHIPLILLTAKSAKRDIVEGLQQGADDYLSKPFDSAELAARIAAQISQKQRLATALFKQFKEKLANTDKQPESEFSTQVVSIIDNMLGDPDFDIGQLSELLNIQRRTFNRRFKSAFDITPVQLLRQQRLKLGLVMLRSGKGNISEIAYACGFESLNYFSRSFNQHFGFTPSQYKKIKD